MGARRKACVAMLAAVAVIAIGQPSAAQPPGEEAVFGSIMFVLDASNSMTAPMDEGGTRMEAAKAAMDTLIDRLPVNVGVGLQVYGSGTGGSAAEKEAGCQDVRTLQEVGPPDKEALHAQVADIQPRGYTPIGTALNSAADALPEDGPRAIVLISDGIDTCAPPAPCDVARDLGGAGVDLAVHAVGFQVEQEARDELDCIASETGGEYHDAPDADSLDDLLPELANRALRYYDVAGDRVSGTERIADAPYLVPGQYTDSVAKNTAHYYRVHVPEGATGHFTVIHVMSKNKKRTDSRVRLRLVDGERRLCVENSGSREYNYDGPETASVSWSPADPMTTCDPSGPHYLEVEWDNEADSASDNIELLVSLENPVDGDQGQAPRTQAVPFTMPEGQQQIAWGGGSFNTAAPLPGPGRYVDKLNYSEYSIYKVWVDWGQALSYQLRVNGGDPANDATVVTELRGPARETSREHWWRSAEHSGDSVALDSVSTPRVFYANREGDDRVRNAAQAGWYYIVVKLSPVWSDPSSSPEEVPTFELAVNVTEERVAGPDYQEMTVPEEAPPLPTTRSTWTPPALAAAAKAATDSGWSWWVVGGIGGAALIGGTTLLLVARHRGLRR
ncbi:VWA domain-containing protein [Saccharomonospora sp. NPDC006951]